MSKQINGRPWDDEARALSAKRVQQRIRDRDLAALPWIRRCQAEGLNQANIARALNAFGVRSPGAHTKHGDRWTGAAVARVLARNGSGRTG